MQSTTRTFTVSAALAVTLSVSGTANAQDGTGAGRWVATAAPATGSFFTDGDTDSSPGFGDYGLGGAFAYNVNRWIGIEGEIGGSVGLENTLNVNGVSMNDASVPRSLSYSGSVIYSFLGNDRPLAPYAPGGVGGLTIFSRDSVQALGVTDTETLFVGNVGGGTQWFLSPRWGLRADYRFLMIDGRSTTPAFIGTDETRYAHRIYGGVVLTGGGR